LMEVTFIYRFSQSPEILPEINERSLSRVSAGRNYQVLFFFIIDLSRNFKFRRVRKVFS
jgi:hypothetical protein